jgi:hypothetical protein
MSCISSGTKYEPVLYDFIISFACNRKKDITVSGSHDQLLETRVLYFVVIKWRPVCHIMSYGNRSYKAVVEQSRWYLSIL